MTRKNVEHPGMRREGLYLVIFALSIVASLLLGCGKEKAIEPKAQPYRATAACEVYDKLPKDIEKHVDVNYGGKVKLLGITANKVAPDKLKVSYFWQVLGDPGAYNVVFVHFTDVGNTSLFGNDHDFCQGKSFGKIKDKFIKENSTVNIPQSAAGQTVDIKVGVYAPTMQGNNRLKIESSGKIKVDDSKTRALVEEMKL